MNSGSQPAIIEELAHAYRAAYLRASRTEQVTMHTIWSETLKALDAWQKNGGGDTTNMALDMITHVLQSGRQQRRVIHEHPEWLTQELLSILEDEARERLIGARQTRWSWYSDAGPAARSCFRGNKIFGNWVCQHFDLAANVLSRSVALSYLYYRRAGDHYPLHVDSPNTHAINCLICLEHQQPVSAAPSALRVYHTGQDYDDIILEPGDAATCW